MAIPRSPTNMTADPNPTTPMDESENPDDETLSRTDRDDLDTPLVRALRALEEARAEIRHQNAFIAGLARAASPTLTAVREPKVSEPSEFSGKISEYRTFMSQCLLTFTMCPRTYVHDQQKVLFVVSYLRGSARDWTREILD